MFKRLAIKLTKHLATKQSRNRDFWQLAHFYFNGMPKGGRRQQLATVLDESVQVENSEAPYEDSDVLIGIWNYASRPYSLGDTLNFCMELTIEALNQKKSVVDLFIVADPRNPAPPNQSHISSVNFEKHLFEMLPAFNMCPIIRNINLVKDRKAFEKELLDLTAKGNSCYPNMVQYFEELDNHAPYGSYFSKFNNFFKEQGWLPKLRHTKGASILKNHIELGFKKDTVFVAIHMRQRQADNQGSCNEAIHRDADQDVWLSFIERAQQEFPQVVFVIVGRFYEFPRKLFHLSNTLILKSYGLGISEELNAILDADLFMGSNSGPATVAFFSDTPYFVYQDSISQDISAKLAEIEVGDPGLKFANKNQLIKWGLPSVDELASDLKSFIKS